MEYEEGTATTMAEQIISLQALARLSTVDQPQPDQVQPISAQFEEK